MLQMVELIQAGYPVGPSVCLDCVPFKLGLADDQTARVERLDTLGPGVWFRCFECGDVFPVREVS